MEAYCKTTFKKLLYSGVVTLVCEQSVGGTVKIPIPATAPTGTYIITVSTQYYGTINGAGQVYVDVTP